MGPLTSMLSKLSLNNQNDEYPIEVATNNQIQAVNSEIESVTSLPHDICKMINAIRFVPSHVILEEVDFHIPDTVSLLHDNQFVHINLNNIPRVINNREIDIAILLENIKCRYLPNKCFRQILDIAALITSVALNVRTSNDRLDQKKLVALPLMCQRIQILKVYGNNPEIKDVHLLAFSTLQELTELEIGNAEKITDNALQKLGEDCLKLEKLTLERGSFSGAAFRDTRSTLRWQNLRELHLTDCVSLTPKAVQAILRLPSLKVLTLPNKGSTDQASTQENTTLEELTLVNSSISGSSLSFMRSRRWDQLKTLTLENYSKVEPEVIHEILTFPSLTTLNVHDTKISNASLVDIARSNITTLDVSNCKRITDEALVYFNNSKISILILGNTNITGKGFVKCPKNMIRELDVSSCDKLANDIFDNLTNCPELQKLSIASTSIAKPNFSALQMHKITYLNLSGCTRISAQDLQQLGTWQHVQRLNIAMIPVALGEFLPDFPDNHPLEELEASSCNEISIEDIKRYATRLRNLKRINTPDYKTLRRPSADMPWAVDE